MSYDPLHPTETIIYLASLTVYYDAGTRLKSYINVILNIAHLHMHQSNNSVQIISINLASIVMERVYYG